MKAEFSPEVQAALAVDPGLADTIATRILDQHFLESLHPDILNAVGISLETALIRRKRDPAFRHRVLKAYEYRCAVCGFDVRLGSVSIALDAAHIRWHQAGGPETEDNGFALCVLHHKTFDLGAFTVLEGIVLVSDQANGTTGFQEALMAHHCKPIRDAQHPDWRPEPKHLDWHGREVFKREAWHRRWTWPRPSLAAVLSILYLGPKCLPRNSLINPAISCPLVSREKCPASSR